MPATKKTAVSKRTTTRGSTNKKSSWLAKATSPAYMKPVLFAVVFMFIGLTSLLWASAATTTQSLWSDSTVPQTLSWNDSRSIELGVKFKSDVAGYVTGVRFYKSAQNTGTHTGSLWDASGNLLGGVTFTNETKSGWQTATFTQPISIAANVTYVVSYHAPKGHYSLGSDYFKSSSHVSGHLTALKYSVSNPNGVNKPSTTAAFPNANGDGDNYYVDVQFSAKLLDPQPAPAAPTGLTASPSNDGTSIALAWQPSLSQNPITNYTVYRNGTKLTDTGTGTTYTDTNVTPGNSYSYQVRATDNTGVSSALSPAVTVTLASSTPPTGSTSCPLPAYPSRSCTGRPSSLGDTYAITVGDGYTVNADNTIIDNWHVTGTLVIAAKNVTIKNSQIDGTVYNDGDDAAQVSSSYTITDSSVGPSPLKDANGNPDLSLKDAYGNPLCNSSGLGSLNGHNITASRVYLYGNQDGVDPSNGGNVTVSDSLIQPCYLPLGTDGFHSDGIQDQCGSPCGHFNFTHNTIDSRAYYKDVKTGDISPNTGNSVMNIGSKYNGNGMEAYDVVMKNNMFAGGGYSVALLWDNVGDKANWIFDSNVWINNSWQYGPVDAAGTCSHMTWTNNTAATVDSNYAITSTVGPINCID
jgi:hypothetical protein